MMKIALTDNIGSEHKFQLYVDWLHRGGIPFEPVRLSYVRDNADALDASAALVLTGGNDVEPRLYGGPAVHPKVTSVDVRRDQFELRVIARAMGKGMPILGICRGMQIVNVHLGGTLLPDIEDAGHPSHRGAGDSECRHGVAVEPGTVLAGIAPDAALTVNSSHHQAVEAPGKGLRIAARSPDGIVEALERTDGMGDEFFLLLQWHPERMADFHNPLSEGVLKRFLSSIQSGKKEYYNEKER